MEYGFGKRVEVAAVPNLFLFDESLSLIPLVSTVIEPVSIISINLDLHSSK